MTKRFFLITSLFILLLPTPASLSVLQAELLPSPFRTTMQLSRVNEVAVKVRGRSEIEHVPTVSIKGRVHGIGFIDARFSTRRNVTWNARVTKNGIDQPDLIQPTLLQGSLAVGGAWVHSGARIFPSAASIIGNTATLTFPGRAKGSRKTRQRIYTITMKLDGSLVVRATVASIPRSAGKRGACGAAVNDGALTRYAYADADADEASSTITPLAANSTGQDGQVELARVVTISTDADPEWYSRYGEQSNAVIASILNTAETIFNKQLNIRFRLVQQHVYADSSPYISTNPSTLLASFAMNPENRVNLGSGATSFHKEVDLKHLFSGKDFDGQTIGIAYIGTVCAIPSMAFGVTQAYADAANASIFAHELGHNFGANHDLSDPEGLMYPAIALPPSQSFSDTSLNEMNSHLARYGTCVSLEQLAPLPDPELPHEPTNAPAPSVTPTSLTLSRTYLGSRDDATIRLSGSLFSALSLPMSGVGIRLIMDDQEIGRASTDSRGRYTFYTRLKLPKGRKVSVHVQTEGIELQSNKLLLTMYNRSKTNR